MRLETTTAVVAALLLAGCGDDEPTPEQRERIEARCVKDLVPEAERIDGEANGFDKWNRLAAHQRECVDDLSAAATDPERD